MKQENTNEMMNYDFIENQNMRDKCVERVEVLEKVGALTLLPFVEMATTKMVADFYNVDGSLIRKVLERNRSEFIRHGLQSMKKSQILELVETNNDFGTRQDVTTENVPSGFVFRVGENEYYFNNSKTILFNKRCVLLVGMLLRDSEVAEEVRNKLLDVYEIVEEKAPHILEGIGLDSLAFAELEQLRVIALDKKDYESYVKLTQKIDELRSKTYYERKQDPTYNEIHQKKQAQYDTLKDNIKQQGYSFNYNPLRTKIAIIMNNIAKEFCNGNAQVPFNELYFRMRSTTGVDVRFRVGEGSMLSKYTNEELELLYKIAVKFARDMFGY